MTPPPAATEGPVMTTATPSAAPARQAGKATLATQVTSCFYCERLEALNHVCTFKSELFPMKSASAKHKLDLDPNAFKDQIDFIN